MPGKDGLPRPVLATDEYLRIIYETIASSENDETIMSLLHTVIKKLNKVIVLLGGGKEETEVEEEVKAKSPTWRVQLRRAFELMTKGK